MHSIIFEYLAIWKPLLYAIIALGIAIDGEAVLFTVLFLAYYGAIKINMYITAVIVFGATIGGDALWYLIGTKFNKLPKIIQGWANKISAPFDRHLHNHTGKLFFFTKFTYGIHHALWVRAGSINVGLKKLIKIDLPATLLWMVTMFAVAEIFSASFSRARRFVSYVEIILLIGLLIFIYIQHVVSRRIANELIEEEKREEEEETQSKN